MIKLGLSIDFDFFAFEDVMWQFGHTEDSAIYQSSAIWAIRYLHYDLENNLVAYINGNAIEIVNLKSRQNEVHGTKDCISAFIGYCIDSLSIKNRLLTYKWIPETKINSGKGK